MSEKNTHSKSGNENFPLLAKSGKTNPYKVPEGYFESLQQKAKLIAAAGHPVPKVIALWSQLATGAVAAAALILAVMLFFEPGNDQTKTELTTEELIEAFDLYTTDTDIELLADYIDQSPAEASLRLALDEIPEEFIPEEFELYEMMDDSAM